MARINKTIQDYQQQLEDKGIKNIPEFVQSILDADITKGKYSRFLLDCFLNDKIREEDLKGGLDSTIGETVSLFHKHKSKLPEEQRSIYKYDSPGSLWNAVKQFDGELSGKEIKRSEQDKVYAETEFVYTDEETGLKIVTPLTEESAKWWGRGTRWCTSAEKNNMYLRYAKESPLLILLMPDGNKLQLWKNKESVQFMDEADNDVDLKYIEDNWELLKPVCLWLKKLKCIPELERTQDICIDFISNDVWNYDYVPKNMITYDLLKAGVQKDGSFLNVMPESLRSEELCYLAVQQDGDSIIHVPENFKTEELYKISVQQNGKSLQYIPKNMITEEICKIAVQQDGESLEYVPEEFKTKEICIMAIKQNGFVLLDIKKDKNICDLKDFLTEEIYKCAVKSSGYAIQVVPEKYLTEELCMLAIKQTVFALYLLNEKYITKELCEMAVRHNGDAISYMPEQFLTEEICKIAVQKDGLLLDKIPYGFMNNYRTEEICKLAVQQNGNAFRYVPDFPKSLKENVKPYIAKDQIPKEKYQEVFSEIRAVFPEKELSLKM